MLVVPVGVSQVDVVAVGARGGVGQAGFGGTVDAPGGFGAVARATLAVTPVQTLYVEVGGNGGDGYAAAGQGGFNGGGAGGVGSGDPVFNFGAGGGGASDVRTSSRTDPTGARLITAGGGGGGGNGFAGYGGAGGSAGSSGAPGTVRLGPCTSAGGGAPGGTSAPGQGGAGGVITPISTGGTAGSNGSLGAGGAGGNEYDIGGGGGGGGGGLYGGGGGGGGAATYPGNFATCTAGGGGGGSSGFAAAATNRSLEIDGSGIPSVTFTWSPPTPPSPPTATIDPAPSIVSLSLTNRTFRVGPRPRGGSRRVRSGTTFSLSLSEAALVRFTVERQTTGRRVRGRCRAATRRNRRARRCTRYVRVGSFTKQLQAGRQRVAWSGRLRNRTLPPARYRAIVQARDTGNLLPASRTVSFRVVR